MLYLIIESSPLNHFYNGRLLKPLIDRQSTGRLCFNKSRLDTVGVRKNAPGKQTPEKLPLGKLSPGKMLPIKIAPVTPLPGKMAPEIFFYQFFVVDIILELFIFKLFIVTSFRGLSQDPCNIYNGSPCQIFSKISQFSKNKSKQQFPVRQI